MAGCKRKIEFDRCRGERRDGRKKTREENAWSPRCGADGGLIEIRILFVGGKENGKT